MKQGTLLEAKRDFAFRNNNKGRPVQVKEGDRFWVTNTEVNQQQIGCILIDRQNKGHMSQGWPVSFEQVEELFDIQGE